MLEGDASLRFTCGLTWRCAWEEYLGHDAEEIHVAKDFGKEFDCSWSACSEKKKCRLRKIAVCTSKAPGRPTTHGPNIQIKAAATKGKAKCMTP